jgi:hypothetical protein
MQDVGCVEAGETDQLDIPFSVKDISRKLCLTVSISFFS